MSYRRSARTKNHSGLWIILVAAGVLEAISCTQYFTSRAAIRDEAERRAKYELRRVELEIEKRTIEMETAAKTLAMLAEKYVDSPDSVYAATRAMVATVRNTSSLAVAYVPGYFPKQGKYFEVCSSRISADSIYTRQIGSDEHDYTQMEWYQNGFVHDSCWWCEPYLDDSGSQTWVVSCSCPVRGKKGETVAVVCIDLSLEYLKDLSNCLQIYKDSYYSIFSHDNQDIVSAADTVPGKRYQIFEEEIDATGWKITIIIPEDVIFADLNRIGRFVGMLMILGLAMLVIIVWYAGRSISRLLDSTAQNQRMENELHIARAIQMAMLPKVFPPFNDYPDLNIYGMVNPAKEVGGDLYDFFIRHDKLFFCIGDVSGKGVPASLVMAMTSSLFRSICSHAEEPEDIVSEMNRTLTEQNTQNMFLTLFLGVLDTKTGRLNYCNAGHNAPMLMTDGHWHMADVHANLPVGIEADFPYQVQTTQMHYGDVLFLYTDGLTEAENSDHEQFGEERMTEVLTSLADTRPRYVADTMQRAAADFVDGAEQSDDLTMLAIRYQMPAIRMRNDIQQIPTLAEWVESLGIPEELNMPVNLALEEIVSNVMLYAYPHDKSGEVFVECVRTHSGNLVFTVSDSGIPFDPTQHAEADITLSAEDRDIGGLGIHLVRQLMDEVHYTREDDKNVLTLIKHI